MKKKNLFSGILFVVFMLVTGLLYAQESVSGSGTFFYSGSKSDEGGIKRNIVYQYLRHTLGKDGFIAFYIANNYRPDNIVFDIKYDIKGSIDIIRDIANGKLDDLGNSCVREFLPEKSELQDEIIKDAVLNKYSQLKGRCVEWSVGGYNVNIVDSIVQSLSPIFNSVREIAVFVSIPQENIELGEVNLNSNYNRDEGEIKLEIIKRLSETKIFDKVFTNNGFKVPHRYNTPEDDNFYANDYINYIDKDDFKGSKIKQEVLVYNRYEYYFFVKYTKLNLTQQISGDSYVWLLDASAQIQIKNISENDALASDELNFKIKVKDNSPDSYMNAIDKLLKAINSYLIFEPIVIGSTATKKEFFKQMYLNISNYAFSPGLSNVNGFKYVIYIYGVKQEQTIRTILNYLQSNYEFNVESNSIQTQGVLVELTKCKFVNIDDFDRALIGRLNGLGLGDFGRKQSPRFYSYLVPNQGETSEACTVKDNGVFIVDLDRLGLDNTIESSNVEVYDEDLNSYTLSVFIPPTISSEANSHYVIKFRINNYSADKKYSITIKGVTKQCSKKE